MDWHPAQQGSLLCLAQLKVKSQATVDAGPYLATLDYNQSPELLPGNLESHTDADAIMSVRLVPDQWLMTLR